MPPRGVPTASKRGAKSEVAHNWARWLHNPCGLGGPERFRVGGKIRGGPAMNWWGPPRQQGLCRHPAHFRATSHFALRSEAVGTPFRQGLCIHLAHLRATSELTPRYQAVATPPGGMG